MITKLSDGIEYMVNRLLDILYERVYVKVGDRLASAQWGESWSVVEVTEVSDDGLSFKGKFVRCKGEDCSEHGGTYTWTVNFLNDTFIKLEK